MKKRMIITGGSDGLGKEVSKLWIEKGYEVICLSRTNPNIGSIHLETDLTDEQSIKNSIKIIKKSYHKFQCIIHCAWNFSLEKLWAVKYKNIEDIFKVNVFSQIIITSELIDLVKENEADIVNVGSTMGYKTKEGQATYTASKWAIRGINENLKLELKNTKCRVIGFNPWGFKSRQVEKVTGVKVDLSPYMEPQELAKCMFQLFELPKKMEVSEIIINRK